MNIQPRISSASSEIAAREGGGSVRAFLNEETRDLHALVDAAFSGDGIETRTGYRKMLVAHARILPALEEKLSKSPHTRKIPHIDSRWRSAHLCEDLLALNCGLPAPTSVSFDDAAPSVAGIMYVLEGSRIGSGFLLKQVLRNEQKMPVSFLSHGREERLWPSFVTWLDAQPWTKAGLSEMRQSALGVFSAYLDAAEEVSTENR